MIFKKITAVIMMVTFLASVPVIASDLSGDGNEKKLELTLKEAVITAVENNLQLKAAEQQVNLNEFYKERTDYNIDKFQDAENDIDDARDMLNQVIDLINYYNLIGEDTTQLESQKQALQNGIQSGETLLGSSLAEANENIADKINLETSKILGVNSTSDLMEVMADTAVDVSKTGYKMGKQKIALLAEKSFYDVIKSQNMLEVKEKALKRAKGQYEIVKAAYEVGMKAKDDMLLAQSQMEFMSADLEKVKGDLKNSKIILKEVLNIPFDKEIILKDIKCQDAEKFDLQEGLNAGLQNRLEMRRAAGEYMVDKLNFELTARKYTSNTFMYREAELKSKASEIDLMIQKQKIESDIRQSYNTLIATEKMKEHIQNSLKNAKENLEIAEYRYNTGFGVPSSNLKSIQAEELTGTIMEVLAAQETVAEIEEKIVEIESGYNLAVSNYLTSIGEYLLD
jgi:outer membrane protein TolC